jgi:hypothetical protein
MLARRALLRTTRLLLAAFLLAQAALALAACDWGARDAARAVTVAAGSGEAPCHESGNTAPDPSLCLPHCLGELQSLDKPSFAVPALAPVAVLFIAPAVSSHAQRVVRRERPLAASAPPPRILFQSLLI